MYVCCALCTPTTGGNNTSVDDAAESRLSQRPNRNIILLGSAASLLFFDVIPSTRVSYLVFSRPTSSGVCGLLVRLNLWCVLAQYALQRSARHDCCAVYFDASPSGVSTGFCSTLFDL